MKTKQIKKLLKKAAIANDFAVDKITGSKKEVDLFAQDQFGNDVLIKAKRNKSGEVNKVSYLNTGLDVFDRSDDLYVAVEVDNAKQFIKGIGDTFKDTFISTENLDLFASFVDSTRGVSPGEFSTYVSINGGLDYSFA